MNISIHNQQVSQKKSRWLFVLKLSVSMGLILLVLSFVDFRELISTTANCNPWYLVGIIVLFHLDRVLMAFKWNQLLVPVGVQVPFSLLFRIYLITPFPGKLLPANIGGDLFRLYSLAQYKADSGAVLASIIVERVIGFAAMIVVSLISLSLLSYLIRDTLPSSREIGWVVVIGVFIGVGLVGVNHRSFKEFIERVAGRFTNYPVVAKLRHVYSLSCGYRNHMATVAIFSAWTLVQQITPILGYFLLVRAFHINMSFLEVMAIIPVISLAVRLPISIDGLGIKEGLFVALFGLFGVSTSEAFLLSMVGRAIPLVSALPWGIHYIIKGQQMALRDQLTA